VTGPHPRQTLRSPAAAGLLLQPVSLATGWCTVCKAETVLTADLLLISLAGVTPVGPWIWCEICDDDNPLPARRITRGRP
jgi:hypothetical protein